MKKRILAVLLALVLVLGLAATSFAANSTGHQISVKIYKVVLDSSKPLGYQTPVLINTITVVCQDSTAHSGYNHSVNLKEFYPTNVGASTTDWTGWEFDSYYTKGKENATFYNWTSSRVNATANVTGSEPYPCSKNFYLVYKDVNIEKYTVTYNDGAANHASFVDQVHTGLAAGTATPAWQGETDKPVWEDHVFVGWNPTVAATVTANVTYVAQWKDDKNHNGIPDDEEDRLTVIYNDGEAEGASFADQKYENLLPGTATPAWEGETDKPVWEDHVFVGWEPEVAETVTESVKYVAQWKDDKNHNGIPDDEEDKLTVIYNDGEAEGTSFADQKHKNLLPGTATPAWEGETDKPVWEDHVFVGWEPEVAETVTESVKYVAQWKDDKNHNGIDDDLEDKLTVVYNDGEAEGTSFADQKHENLLPGTATPAWEGETDKPVWEDHVFVGWEPEVAEKVTESVKYVAQWKDDKNHNGIPDDEEDELPEDEEDELPDDEEDELTVVYNDGEAEGASFADQKHENLLPGTATPAWEGETDKPVWKDHLFNGWAPEVSETVKESVTYVAQWKNDRNNNGIDDDQEEKYTVTYTDGVDGEEIFKDQVYEGLLEGEATPKFDGKNPTRKGYTFVGWKPEVAEKVTATVTYVAQWKKLDAVQTGDSMNLTVWFCLLGVAGMGFVSAVVLAKKKQDNK